MKIVLAQYPDQDNEALREVLLFGKHPKQKQFVLFLIMRKGKSGSASAESRDLLRRNVFYVDIEDRETRQHVLFCLGILGAVCNTPL